MSCEVDVFIITRANHGFMKNKHEHTFSNSTAFTIMQRPSFINFNSSLRERQINGSELNSVFANDAGVQRKHLPYL